MIIIVELVPQFWGSSGVIMKSRKIVSALVAFAVAGITTFGAPNMVQATRTIYVPDDAFETKLISLGYDTGALNDYVPFENIRDLTSLDLSNTQITDYEGLNYFSSLATLNLSGNTTVTSLTTSSLPLPTSIRTVNLSGATRLARLTISGDYETPLGLTGVTLTGNTALTSLSITNTSLSAVDVSSFTALTSLNLSRNKLTTLNTASNTALTTFQVSNNQLSTLDLSTLTLLDYLQASNNKLTSVN